MTRSDPLLFVIKDKSAIADLIRNSRWRREIIDFEIFAFPLCLGARPGNDLLLSAVTPACA